MTFEPIAFQDTVGGSFGLLAVSLVLSILAIVLSATVLWRWRRHEARIVVAPSVATPVDPPRQLLHEFEKNSRSVDDPLVTWTPDTLRQILETELPDAR